MVCREESLTGILMLACGVSCLWFVAVKPKLPHDFEEKTWEKLKGAVHAVQHKRSVTSSLEDLYRVGIHWITCCGRNE